LNPAAWALLTVAGVLAAGDWVAVSPGIRSRDAEFVLKPLAMIALIAVGIALKPEHDAERVAFLAGLVLSLAGDVFLMLPTDAFVAGLASFLAAHVAYVVGFVIAGVEAGRILLGLAIVSVGAVTVGRGVLRAVREDHRSLAVAVTAYMTIISVMVVLAIGSGEVLAAGGALFFYVSDSLIAWDRFVEPRSWARPAIMATYHIAQAGLVLSLAR